MHEYYSKEDLLHYIHAKLRYLGDAESMNKGDEDSLAQIKGYAHAFEHFENALTESCDDEIPKADVQPVKHGKWLSRCEGDIYDFSECSECGNMESCETPYCAQCGARMDRDAE